MQFIEQFWWERITGPSNLVKKVADLLHQNSHVALLVPADLPWRHQMRRSIEAAFKSLAGSDKLSIIQVDAAEEYDPEISPGQFLLNKQADTRIKSGYREQSGKTLQAYLTEKGVLKNSLVWIKGLHVDSAKQWIKFVKEYPCQDWQDGIFVLEIPEELPFKESKYLKDLSFRSFVSRYDLQILNVIILDEYKTLPDDWKKYLATLVSYLCIFDSELSETLLKGRQLERNEPIECLIELSQSLDYQRRGLEPNSDHILSMVREQKYQQIEGLIWIAQIESLLPRIEFLRQTIIKDYLYEEINRCLKAERVQQFESTVEDPLDLELGTLVHLMHKRTTDFEYALYVSDENLRDLLELLKECRNRLAHMKICSLDLVERLLSVEIR